MLSDDPAAGTRCAAIDRLGRSRLAVHPARATWYMANGSAASSGEPKRASTCGPPGEYHLPKVFSKLGISSRQFRHYLALA